MEFKAHPPERRRRSTVLVAAGCCCCCCCCVHTLGGIVGAVLGARRKNLPAPETLITPAAIQVEEERKQLQSRMILLYWLCVLIMVTLTCGICLWVQPREPLIGPAIVAGFLPVGQFAASCIALGYLYLKRPPRLDECVRVLDRISVYAFLWGLFGCLGSALTLVAIAIH